jgi:putative ABC transport system substrate-binding protein
MGNPVAAVRFAFAVAVSLLCWHDTFAQLVDKPVRVGIIAFSTKESNEKWEQSLVDGLRQRGYVEGRNLVIERRHGNGNPERMPQVAAELAALNLDVIVTTCTPSTRAMTQATRTTPLVMAAVTDPVGQGLIASYSRPGGNITGLASQFEDLAAKMLGLLREAVPGASPVAVLFNPRNPVHKVFLQEIESAAPLLNVRVWPVEVGLRTDLPATFANIARQGIASVLILPDDPTLAHLRRQLVSLAMMHHLPSFFGLREAVEEGGLMSYGESTRQSFFRAASYVDKVVKGERPAVLPVEQPTRFEFVINLNTAKALGVRVPPSVLIRADEVLQ